MNFFFGNLQKVYFFSKPQGPILTYMWLKVIKIVAAICALNLPLYDLLKEMYYFEGLFFLVIYSPRGEDVVLRVTEIIYEKNGFQKRYNKRI